ncbi:MAG: hypothetical protein VB137_14710 [Burkholderia sp.]
MRFTPNLCLEKPEPLQLQLLQPSFGFVLVAAGCFTKRCRP